MEVNINEITSTVRAVDSEALLAPETMQKIVRAVMTAVREHEEHRERLRVEQQVWQGVRDAPSHDQTRRR